KARAHAGGGILDSLAQMQPARRSDLSVEVNLESDPPRGLGGQIDTLPIPSTPNVPGFTPPSSTSGPATPTATAVLPPEELAAMRPRAGSRTVLAVVISIALIGAVLLVVGVIRNRDDGGATTPSSTA